MNKDRAQGKAKDIAGRVERQAGEWTGDSEKQAHGAMKQAEGKVQNAWGKMKDAARKTADDAKSRERERDNERRTDETVETEADIRLRRKAS